VHRRDGMSGLWLTTPRLALRPLSADTAALLVDDHAAGLDRLGTAADPDWPSRDEIDLFAALRHAPARDERFGPWLVIVTHAALVIGTAGFTGPPQADGSVEIGFGITPRWRRRGYASEATSALVRFGLGQRGVVRVIARCAATNTASRRVMGRVGMAPIGARDGLLAFARGSCRDRSASMTAPPVR
jgi:[ribosomal protein S5]-alanine N-acetyltransferase